MAPLGQLRSAAAQVRDRPPEIDAECDTVTQVENDYNNDVYNGDLGVVSRIDMEESELAVDFDGAKSPTALANWCLPMR